MECGKFCAHFGHLITLMASLFTMILLVMVYFIMPPPSHGTNNQNSTGVVTIISRPSVSNVWFQQSEDAWLPNRFQTWSPEDQQKDFNQTIVEGEHLYYLILTELSRYILQGCGLSYKVVNIV